MLHATVSFDIKNVTCYEIVNNGRRCDVTNDDVRKTKEGKSEV